MLFGALHPISNLESFSKSELGLSTLLLLQLRLRGHDDLCWMCVSERDHFGCGELGGEWREKRLSNRQHSATHNHSKKGLLASEFGYVPMTNLLESLRTKARIKLGPMLEPRVQREARSDVSYG